MMTFERRPEPSITRREFVAGAVGAFAAASCGSLNVEASGGAGARLAARPGDATTVAASETVQLWSGSPSAYLVIPDGVDPSTPLPFVVSLHGAGIRADGPLGFLGPYARAEKFFLLVPDSHGATWDGMIGAYGPDIATIDRALHLAFARCRVDPSRVTLEGFSDGASYALGVGLANADLFKRIVAFSPGFITPTQVGTVKPRVFVSHGRQDPILSYENTETSIVPLLRSAGCTVEFHPYDGVHSVTADIARAGVDFMTQA
jgi:phospholipase/carboxylesterase